VPQQFLPDIKRYDRDHKLGVAAKVQGEAEANGVLTFIDNSVDPQTGMIKLKGTFPNADHKLWPGQFVRVTLKGARRPNAVTVPQRAVLEGPQGKFVYVLSAESKAEPRPVQVGEWIGDDWIIQSGLKAGDKVIVDGVARIFAPGSPVVVGDPAKQGEDASKAPAKK